MGGPALMLAGIGLYALLDTNTKWLSAGYGLAQVVGARCVSGLLAVLLLALLLPRLAGPLGTGRPGLHLLRSAAAVGASVSYYFAFSRLSLAEGYLMFFTAPFLGLAMSALALREKVPAAVWGWCAVGFGGVALAVAPQLAAGGDWRAYLAALLGSLCHATVMTVNRRLRGEHGLARLLLWPCLLGTVLLLPFALGEWQAPQGADWGLLAMSGLLWGGASVSIALAFRQAPASRLAPLEFSALVWSLALDLLFWGVLPRPALLLGAAVVVVACLMSQRVAPAH
ncbi:DMT family transporter [Roseomonas sp. NAR14]|uniref:DMT family transporter n=1 Tax=Roseomonas acroporae TaxID=2937791 RepID=A0A9X2BXH2_9PROT|nr:DMT family transporter [Roseomonas acroporae]MCK8784950.1 DMT family transporter [Roseomonas acroporae]